MKCKIREEIFELYFYMVIPFIDLTNWHKDYRHTPQPTNYSNHISHTLLRCCLRPSVLNSDALDHLAATLLDVSLAHACYSTSLTSLFNDLLKNIGQAHNRKHLLRKLAPSITNYLEVGISIAHIHHNGNLTNCAQSLLLLAYLFRGSSWVSAGDYRTEECMEATSYLTCS